MFVVSLSCENHALRLFSTHKGTLNFSLDRKGVKNFICKVTKAVRQMTNVVE